MWDKVVWRLLKLAGPNGAAYRPRLWRAALVVPLLKNGDPFIQTSFRLIMVKAQMGLIQEGLLSERLLERIQCSLERGQSGYVRGVQDPHLLLHEILSESRRFRRDVWLLPGDFVKAFPLTWREDLLNQISEPRGSVVWRHTRRGV